MGKKICIMLSQGFEEIEYTTPLDLWCRAGIEVSTVKIETDVCDKDNLYVTGTHGLQVLADDHWHNWAAQNIRVDLLLLPGGLPGSANLAAHKELTEYLILFASKLTTENSYLAALCASPALVLGKATGILKDRNYICYPGMGNELADSLNAEKKTESVVLDQRILTAEGPGVSHLLAFRAIELLCGIELARTVLTQARYPGFFYC